MPASLKTALDSRLQCIHKQLVRLILRQWIVNIPQRGGQAAVSQQLPYAVQRDAGRVQIAGKGFPYLMAGFDWHTPVSYTHLDVYKRQGRDSGGAGGAD